jgi:hypothetical protein
MTEKIPRLNADIARKTFINTYIDSLRSRPCVMSHKVEHYFKAYYIIFIPLGNFHEPGTGERRRSKATSDESRTVRARRTMTCLTKGDHE